MHLDTFLLQYGYAIGYLLIFIIIFAESGLLIGFFLPGDSLLFTVGLLASQGHFDIALLLLLGCVAAVSGDSVGYLFGKKVGPSLFNKPDSLLFKHENVEKAQHFYEEHGKKTIVLARFIPIVRTFAPIVAGIGNMHYKTFVAYNVIGGITWVCSILLAGYFLGSTIPSIDRYILPIIAAIVIASVIPAIRHMRSGSKS